MGIPAPISHRLSQLLGRIIPRKQIAIGQLESLATVFGFVTLSGAAITVCAFLYALVVRSTFGWVFFVVLALIEIAVATCCLVAYIVETQAVILDPLKELISEAMRVSAAPTVEMMQPHGSLEFQQLSSIIGTQARQIAHERAKELSENQEGKSRETTLRYILRYAHDVGGSLNLKTIVGTLADVSMSIGGYKYAQVWIVNDMNGHAKLEHTSGPTPTAGALNLKTNKEGRTAVERSIATAQAVQFRLSDGATQCLAIPLVHGLTIIGSLELIDQALTITVDDPINSIEALAQYAATAVVAARLHQEVEARSETDGLTRIFNRRKFDADLRSEVARGVRYGHPLSLLMIDVDHFKKVNDTFGHQQGDEVLKAIAGILTESIRETDSAYRYGGEEFALLLRETDADAARDAAERFRIKVEHAHEQAALPCPVSVSLGVAAVGEGRATPELLIKGADAALYEAKETGRNRVVVNLAVTKQ